jgi:hypothetical protein
MSPLTPPASTASRECQPTEVRHCCWIEGRLCRHLTAEIRCSLRTELGSWKAVHADPRWVADVKPTFDRLWPGRNYGCGHFPQLIPEVMGDPLAGKCCNG